MLQDLLSLDLIFSYFFLFFNFLEADFDSV